MEKGDGGGEYKDLACNGCHIGMREILNTSGDCQIPSNNVDEVCDWDLVQEDFTFHYNLDYICASSYTTITASSTQTMPNLCYEIDGPELVHTFTGDIFTITNPTNCGSNIAWSYKVTQTPADTIEPVVAVSDGQVVIKTHSAEALGESADLMSNSPYTINVEGQLPEYFTTSTDLTFQLSFTNNNPMPPPDESETWTLSTTASSYTMASWSSCDLSYTVTSDTTPASIIVSFDSATRVLSWNAPTPDAATAGQTYTVQIQDTLASGTWTFTLTVATPCEPPTVTATSLAAQTYTIGSGPVHATAAFAAFTVDPSFCTITYAFVLTPATPWAPPLSILDQASRLFRYDEDDIALAGSYTATVQAVTPGGVVAANTFDYSVTLVDPCLTRPLSIDPTIIADFSYTFNSVITSDVKTLLASRVTEVTPNAAACPAIELQVTEATGDAALDANIFSFALDANNVDFTLTTTSPTDPAQMSAYFGTTLTLKVHAKFTGAYPVQDTHEFVVTFPDPCLTPTSLAAGDYSLSTAPYLYDSTSFSFVPSATVVDPSFCPPTYACACTKQSDGSSCTAFPACDDAVMDFSVTTGQYDFAGIARTDMPTYPEDTYDFTVTVSVGTGAGLITETVTFFKTFEDPCLNNAVSVTSNFPPTFNPVVANYILHDVAKTGSLDPAAFTTDPVDCPRTYTFTTSHSDVDPVISNVGDTFTADYQSLNNDPMGTANPLAASRSFTITVTCEIGDNVKKSSTHDFIVIIENPCFHFAVINPYTPSPWQYTLFDPASTGEHGGFSVNTPYDTICGTISKSVTFDGDPLPISTAVTQLTYDEPNRDITVYSTDYPGGIGIHTLVVSAVFTDYPTVTGTDVTNTLEFIDPCIDPDGLDASASIYDMTLDGALYTGTEFQYLYTGTTASFSLCAGTCLMVPTPNVCTVTYTCSALPAAAYSGGSDLCNFNGVSIWSFDDTAKEFKLNTNDLVTYPAGRYTVTITGSVGTGAGTNIEAQVDIVVDLVDPCLDPLYSQIQCQGPLTTPAMTYVPGATTTATRTIDNGVDYTFNPLICTVEYSIAYGQSPFFTLTDKDLDFDFSSVELAAGATPILKTLEVGVTGDIGNTQPDICTFEYQVPCQATTSNFADKLPANFHSAEYDLATSIEMTTEFELFDAKEGTYECGYQWTYELSSEADGWMVLEISEDDGASWRQLPASEGVGRWLTVESGQAGYWLQDAAKNWSWQASSDLGKMLRYKIGPPQSTTLPSAGTYTITLTATLNDPNAMTETLQIEVTLVAPPTTFTVEANTAPFFSAPPEGGLFEVTKLGTEDQFEFFVGEPIDYEQDPVDVQFTFPEGLEDLFSYSLDSQAILVSSEIKPGQYEITATITDENKELPKTTEYSFTINILEKVDITVEIDQKEEEEEELPEIWLDKVSPHGVATIQFTQFMIIPSNFTENMNDTVLRIEVEPGLLSDPDELKIAEWNVTRYSKSSMDILIVFENSFSVSLFSSPDTLKITILQPEFFISMETFGLVKNETSVEKNIPPQTNQANVEMLESVAGSIEDAGSLTTIVTVVINVVLGSSLSMLWGMANALQIIAFFPELEKVVFPNMIQTILESIQLLSTGDWIAWDAVKNFFIAKQEEGEEDEELMVEGEEEPVHIIDAIGVVEVGILTLAGVGALILLMLMPCKAKSKRVTAMYMWISAKIFWNLPLRLLLESYLEYLVQGLESLKAWQMSPAHRLMTIYQVIMLGILVIFPLFAYYWIKKNVTNLHSENFKKKFGSLTLDLSLSQDRLVTNFNVVFMTRRMVYALILVFMDDVAFAQIQLIVFLSSLSLIYIAGVKPFTLPTSNKLEIFNECCILAACYSLLAFTDWVTDAYAREIMSYYLLAICGLTCVVNMGVIALHSIKEMIHKCKIRQRKKDLQTAIKLIKKEKKARQKLLNYVRETYGEQYLKGYQPKEEEKQAADAPNKLLQPSPSIQKTDARLQEKVPIEHTHQAPNTRKPFVELRAKKSFFKPLTSVSPSKLMKIPEEVPELEIDRPSSTPKPQDTTEGNNMDTGEGQSHKQQQDDGFQAEITRIKEEIAEQGRQHERKLQIIRAQKAEQNDLRNELSKHTRETVERIRENNVMLQEARDRLHEMNAQQEAVNAKLREEKHAKNRERRAQWVKDNEISRAERMRKFNEQIAQLEAARNNLPNQNAPPIEESKDISELVDPQTHYEQQKKKAQGQLWF